VRLRPLLVFAAVFTVGGALLWVANLSSSRPNTDRPTSVGGVGPEVRRRRADPGPMEPAPRGQDGPLFVRIDGQASVDTYAAGGGARHGVKSRLAGHFTALDEAFTHYRVDQLTLEVLDPLTQEVIETLTARSGTFRVEPGGGAHALTIANGGQVLLEEVQFVRHTQHAFAPLTLQAPRLELLLSVNELRSIEDDAVEFTGNGLAGGGQGLLFEGESGLLRLERGGEVVMQRPQGGEMYFSTPGKGPLEIRQTGPSGTPGSMEALAVEGARLILKGDSPGQVDARTLRLVGHSVDGTVILESAEAEGQVLVVSGDGRYSGARAQLKLDESGELETLILEENPTAQFTILRGGGVATRILSKGRGPLTVAISDTGTRFTLVGPGFAEALGENLKIHAEGTLQGIFDSERTHATILARERVRVIQGANRLETDTLDAVFLAGEEERADLFCEGPTRVTRRDPVRGLVSVDVNGEADLRLRDTHWQVLTARAVRTDVVGPDPVRVTAGLIENLDLATWTFEASEGVTWAGVQGEGSSNRAQMDANGVLHLLGTETVAANVRVIGRGEPEVDPEALVGATIQAQEIHVSRQHFEATGDVRLEAETGSGHLEVLADSAHLNLARPEPEPGHPGEPGGPAPFALQASGVRRATLEGPDSKTVISAQHLSVLGVLADGAGGEKLATSDLVATGDVWVERGGALPLEASGDTLVMEGEGRGRLVAAQGARVQVGGHLLPDGREFQFSATSIIFDGQQLRASEPEASLQGVSNTPPGGAGLALGELRVAAKSLEANPAGMTFSGGVLLQGTDAQGMPIILRAGRLWISGAFDLGAGALSPERALHSLEASEGFNWVYGGLGRARGQRMIVTRQRASFWGAPDEPASIEVGRMGGTLSLQSRFIELDLDLFLVSADRGVIRAMGQGSNWSVSFADLRPDDRDGQTLIAMAAPRFEDGTNEARADFAGFWIHGDRWRARGQEALWGTPLPLEGPGEPQTDVVPPSQGPLVENVFRRLMAGDLSRFVRAALAEGNIEVVENGRLAARASAIYLDMEQGRGVLENATLVARMQIARGRTERVRVSAEEIRTAADGSLRADKATLTTSTHDEPTYVIETSKLVLTPRPDELWEVSARGNRLVFANRIGIPLPPLGNLALNERGDVVGFVTDDNTVRRIDNLVLGDSARFGPMLGAAFRSDVGRMGRKVGELLGFGEHATGRWHSELSYLGSRGALFGLGLDLRERRPEVKQDSWFRVTSRGIHDENKDRGLVRVPEEDRDSLRLWTSARGRYPFSNVAWVDLALSGQTDPGVQAEFFQRQYQRYEERDNYLHYRDGRGADYFDAMFRLRVDSFRTEVIEQPSLGYYHGERSLGQVAGVDLLYGASLELDSLSRYEGDPDYEFPFADNSGVPDGLGDRSVMRASTSQRLSAPLRTDLAGLRVTPWLEGRGTIWDEGAQGSGGVIRSAALAGIDMATTLFRLSDSGWRHSLTPTLSYSSDLFVDLSGGSPVRFDALDDPLGADEWGVGLRALWTDPENRRHYDLEVKGLHRFHRASGQGNQTQLATLGSLRTTVGKVPVGLLHDGRIDLETGRTLYSRSTFAWRPQDPLLLQFVFRRGFDPRQGRLFEAASFDVRWRIDPKWEIEVGEDISIVGNANLRSHLALRRFGADFLLETVLVDRAGEGGPSLSISFSPLFLWSPRRMGMLDD
jgi:hypothetical protein